MLGGFTEDLGFFAEHPLKLARDLRPVDSYSIQKNRNHAIFLAEEGKEEMFHVDLGVIPLSGLAGSILYGFLRFKSVSFVIHGMEKVLSGLIGGKRSRPLFRRGSEAYTLLMEQKIVVLHGFSGEEALAAMRAFKAGLPSCREAAFATTTEMNLEWKVAELVEHVGEEHRRFKENNQGRQD
jgi:hypothetical protein